MKTNYMIGTWSGKRLRDIFDQYGDVNYLKHHINQLNNISHGLTQVTIGYPSNPDESASYTEYITNLTQLNDGTPIVVMPMENDGLSYGQWSRIFEKYQNDFDYFIFNEDDYSPVTDNFDQIMLTKFNELEDCGFLCGLKFEGDRYKVPQGSEPLPCHAGSVFGITSTKILKEIWQKYGALPHESGIKNGQMKFSDAFLECGYIEDITETMSYKHLDTYRSNILRLFCDCHHLNSFHNIEGEDFLQTFQNIEINTDEFLILPVVYLLNKDRKWEFIINRLRSTNGLGNS
jgi:hypothetical protein